MNQIKNDIRRILDTFTSEQLTQRTWYEITGKLSEYFNQSLQFGLVTKYKITNEINSIHIFYDVGLGLTKNSKIYYGEDQALHHIYEEEAQP